MSSVSSGRLHRVRMRSAHTAGEFARRLLAVWSSAVGSSDSPSSGVEPGRSSAGPSSSDMVLILGRSCRSRSSPPSPGPLGAKAPGLPVTSPRHARPLYPSGTGRRHAPHCPRLTNLPLYGNSTSGSQLLSLPTPQPLSVVYHPAPVLQALGRRRP